jgi:hypothetical protein
MDNSLRFDFEYEHEEKTSSIVRVRNRKADPSTWKRNNRAKRPRKEQGPCSCPGKCFTLFKASDRDTMRSGFDAKSRSEQQVFMAGLIDVQKRKARMVALSVRRRRAREFEATYNLLKGPTRTRVCKDAFKSILGVQDTRLKNLNRKVLSGDAVEQDARGKHGKQRRVEADIPVQIDAHIRSFPTEASHYCLNKTEEFLDSELSVSENVAVVSAEV